MLEQHDIIENMERQLKNLNGCIINIKDDYCIINMDV
jgi:hypothetical protein